MVTLGTTNSDKKNPTFSIFAFLADLRTNSNFSPYNAASVCLLRSTDWTYMQKFRSLPNAQYLSSLAQAVLASNLQAFCLCSTGRFVV